MGSRFLQFRARNNKGKGLYTSISRFGAKMRPVLKQLGKKIIPGAEKVISDAATTMVKAGGKAMSNLFMDRISKGIKGSGKKKQRKSKQKPCTVKKGNKRKKKEKRKKRLSHFLEVEENNKRSLVWQGKRGGDLDLFLNE